MEQGTITGLCKELRNMTWTYSKTLSSLYSSTRIGCGSTAVQCAVFATCSSLLTRERTQLSTRRDTALLLFFHPSLDTCTTVPRAYSNPRCRLRPMLKPSDIANSAPTRTIQARIYIVRVPAIVRVISLGTYPHYRGTSTVLVHLTRGVVRRP